MDITILSAVMLNEKSLLVETTWGSLFLDEDDFKQFNFDPYYVIDHVEDEDVLQLMMDIKIYYVNQALDLIKKGEISYEDIK